MFIADTSIVSYCYKNNPISSLYAAELNSGAKIFISSQTWEEMLFGAFLDGWGEKRLSQLRNLLSSFTVLPIDQETAEICADIRVGAVRLGKGLSTADAWIIATAVQYDLILLAHDRDMMVCNDLGGSANLKVHHFCRFVGDQYTNFCQVEGAPLAFKRTGALTKPLFLQTVA